METRVAEPDEAPAGGEDEGPADAASDGADANHAGEPSPVDGLTAAGRRRLARAWLAGSAPTFLVYAWILMVQRWAPLQVQFFDDFYDAQARSLFDGRLDVPPEVVGFEGFLIDGKTYIYFGPFPSLLRMPLLAVTDRFDGRLTTLSMLAATAVLAWAGFRLACVIRGVVRGAVPVGRREAVATAVLAVAVLTGPPLFLAGGAVVYHEAAAWGLALSVASYDAVARWQRAPSGRRLAVASALLTAAILSRQTLALGALAALGIAGLWRAYDQWRASAPTPEPGAEPDDVEPAASGGDPPSDGEPGRRRDTRQLLARTLLPLALAGAVPLAASMALNYAKLGQLLGLPMDKQVQSILTDDRADVIEANATFVGLEYVSTTARQYLASPGLDVRRDFPWLDFPRRGPTLVDDDAVFDELDWSSSMPASAPIFVVLTVPGAVWTVRARRRRGPRGRLLPLWAGGVIGGVSVLAFGYIANRYLNDILPLALVGGLVGFHAAGSASARWSAGRRRALMAGAGVLVGFGALVNAALALEYQHERGPAVPESWRADWVDWRAALPGAPEPMVVGPEADLPPVADGGLLVVGDCDGLYVGVEDRWLPVERGPGVGVDLVSVDLDRLPVGDRFPIATYGEGDRSTVIGVVRLGDGEARVDVLGPDDPFGVGDPPAEWELGEPLDLGGRTTFRISTDPRERTANVAVGDRIVNPAQLPRDEGDLPMAAGAAPDREGIAPSTPGVETVEPDHPVCDAVTGA